MMIDGEQHARRALAGSPGARQIRSPAHFRRRRNDRAFVRARPSRGAAARWDSQLMLAHQTKYAAAAGADPSVAQLRPPLSVALAEKRRGGKHRADVLDEFRHRCARPWGPSGPHGRTDQHFERSTGSSEPSPPEHTPDSAGQFGSGKSTRPVSLVRLPRGQRAVFPLIHRLISREISRFRAVSPSAFCRCVIFSSRPSTSRLFSPERPLAKNTSRQDDSVAALTFNSRESASSPHPSADASLQPSFFLEDHRPRSSSVASFFLRIRHSSGHHFGPKACPGNSIPGERRYSGCLGSL